MKGDIRVILCPLSQAVKMPELCHKDCVHLVIRPNPPDKQSTDAGVKSCMYGGVVVHRGLFVCFCHFSRFVWFLFICISVLVISVHHENEKCCFGN